MTGRVLRKPTPENPFFLQEHLADAPKAGKGKASDNGGKRIILHEQGKGRECPSPYQWLYSQKPFEGFGDSERAKFMDQMLSRQDPDYASNPDIKWNFTKFLIDRKGRVVERFEPVVAPEEMTAFIEKEL